MGISPRRPVGRGCSRGRRSRQSSGLRRRGRGACGCRELGHVTRPADTRYETAESISSQRPDGCAGGRGSGACRRLLIQRPMWAMSVVVLEELLQYHREVALSGDQELVEAFPAERADEAFGDRVRPWCPYRGADDPDVGTGEDRVERGGELAVPVADQEPEPVGAFAEVYQEVAGLLGHPGPSGMAGDPGEVHAATAVLDNQEDVEAAEEDGVDVGEIDRKDRVGLRGEELSTRWTGSSWRRIESRVYSRSSRRSRRQRDGRGRSVRPECACTPSGDSRGPSAAPGSDRRCGGWSAWSSARVGPAAGDELGVPAQQGSRRDQPQLAQRGGQ